MLQLTDITKAFSEQTLLNAVSLRVARDSHMALVGRNGAGKSTLLRIILDELEPDSGEVYRAPGLRVGCLTQDPKITPGNTLEEEMRSLFSELNHVMAEEEKLRTSLESMPEAEQAAALERLNELYMRMGQLEPATLEANISRMLTGLGFSDEDKKRPVEAFSGGWQMRISLAKVLLTGADILLLDEPTNHLDLEACEWLENFIKTYDGGVVVVSHDRHFLDAVTSETIELELGRLTVWPGNYSKHLELKADMLDKEASAVHRQQKELAKQTAFVERFRASATKSTQAKSREKQLAKIERVEMTQTNTRRMNVKFSVEQRSGQKVLELKQIAKAYTTPLFSGVKAEIERGQRIFILGENGCGKTTLLRVILGLETPDSGEIIWGHNITTGYFSQNQLDTLDPKREVFETLRDERPEMTQTALRTILGQFLFTGDQVFKPVEVLSGGEKSKLALAKLLLSGPNFLILDEPTNHMDIAAKDVLEDAFLNYDGTMLCISHDRHFIETLATNIWEIYEGGLIQYPGGYDYYLEKRDEFRERARQQRAKQLKTQKTTDDNASATSDTSSSTKNTTPLKQKQALQKQVAKLEKEMASLEADLARVDAEMLKPDIQSDYKALQSLNEDRTAISAKLQKCLPTWEALAEELLALDA
jgi:ATP-binding cassette, subfamily F, member 3